MGWQVGRHQEILRLSRAVTVKKCTKKCNARTELLFWLLSLFAKAPYCFSRLRIYNWKKLTPLAYLSYHTDAINAVDFSHDMPDCGQLLAAGGKDARISLWSLYNDKGQRTQEQAR